MSKLAAGVPMPVVLVAERPARLAARRESLARIGVTADYYDDAPALVARLAADWSVDAVMLDLALATPELLHRLVALGLSNGGPAVIAFADADSADAAGIALSGNIITFLEPDASDAELDAALQQALADDRGGVAERNSPDFADIGSLSREVERIAQALAQMAVAERAPLTAAHEVTSARIRALLKARRARERFFPAELFSDPAWDMLLDLTAAQLDNQMVSVSSLCIAAAVPTTTALRWIRNLCDAGLFERRVDAQDARRAFIVLGDASFDAMKRYLAGVGPGVGVV